jgi:hypothetical protein
MERFNSSDNKGRAVAGTAVMRVVRIRETQEYDIGISTNAAEAGLEAARQARLKFLGMTPEEQAANSLGVTSRIFDVDDEEFDDDELNPDE